MWQVTRDRWHVTRDTWHVTHDTWHMTHSVGWTFSRNFSSLALPVWDWQCFEYIFTNHNRINHEAVYRTAPATPSLLKNTCSVETILLLLLFCFLLLLLTFITYPTLSSSISWGVHCQLPPLVTLCFTSHFIWAFKKGTFTSFYFLPGSYLKDQIDYTLVFQPMHGLVP